MDAIVKELKQLHDRKVIKPVDVRNMTSEERKKALAYLMFIKEKRDGSVKARGCADGRKQREHIKKEESSSPTVAIESVFIQCVMNAKEGRDVATVDVPNTFMQADNDELVHMKLEGHVPHTFASKNTGHVNLSCWPFVSGKNAIAMEYI